MMYRTPLLLALILLAPGCTSTRSYSVSVTNGAMEPVTVWLTKDGPPAEVKWLSPEQLAMGMQPKREPISGVTVPPGKTADVGPIDGQFYSDTNAVLRVYRGSKKFSEMLAVGADSPNRTDVVLQPGVNTIEIDSNGKPRKK